MTLSLLHILILLLFAALVSCSPTYITVEERSYTTTPPMPIRPDSTIELQGRVYDTQGNVINWGVVRVEGTTKGAYIDSNGIFRIRKIRPGNYSLDINSLGFKKETIEIEALCDINISVALQKDGMIICGGCLIGRPLADPERIGTIHTISSDELTRTPP